MPPALLSLAPYKRVLSNWRPQTFWTEFERFIGGNWSVLSGGYLGDIVTITNSTRRFIQLYFLPLRFTFNRS